MPTKRRKHVPLRSCIACRTKSPKRDLIRVVRTPEGTLEVDTQGKRAGRGAYLCRKSQCCETALQPGRLSQALKCQVPSAEVAALKETVLTLIEETAAESETAPQDGAGAQG
ncbi:MAG: RNase P modulator RnpM [Anaerolineae bacterium]